MNTREMAEGFRDEIVALRRALHQVPEYDLDLPKTQQLNVKNKTRSVFSKNVWKV